MQVAPDDVDDDIDDVYNDEECRQHLPNLARRRGQVRQGNNQVAEETGLLHLPPALR